MSGIALSRRALVAGAAVTALSRPAIIRAQTSSAPIRIGLLSDVTGPYRQVGGPGGKVAVELAVEDFGGSLLGRPIEVMQADIFNKPDVASARAREWIDGGVNMLMDGAATSSGLAVQAVAREKRTIFIGNGPAASDFTGKFCSPYGFHFWANTYSLAKGTGGALTRAGGTTWFFITADYQFGYSLEADTTKFVTEAGGKVLGSVKAPLGTADFSSALVQAQASGAKVVAFANAGTDLRNCVKQAHEFGLVKGGQSLATLLMMITDVVALGQDVCEGLVLSNSFYWDLTPATRAWSARFASRMEAPPTMVQAANYSGALHWMRAVQAAGTLDGDSVAARMRAMPVRDFYHDYVPIQPNGQVLDPTYVWRVKPASQAAHPWDFYERVGEIPGKDAYMPLDETGCALGHP
ncbi:MAG TPA: ABC transporter substrate-binding protein [Acetobacteraceae bacterium]|nr:ABC transporter substrate-binding protein [Acetobacteraceae bacterium]